MEDTMLKKAIQFFGEVKRDLQKANLLTPDKNPYEPKTSLVDPFSFNFQTYGYKERYSYLDYGKLKVIAAQDPILSAIIQTRMNQIAAFAVPQIDKYDIGFKISLRDKKQRGSKGADGKIKELQTFTTNTGTPESFTDTIERKKRDNFETFLRKIVRDSMSYDQVNFEVVPRRNGLPAEFVAVDASTMRLIADRKEMEEAYAYREKEPIEYADISPRLKEDERKAKYPRLCQVIRGIVYNTYDEWEMAFGIRNPRTDILVNGYGYSEIEMLIASITAHMNAETYNRKFFSQGSAIKGVLAFEGKVPPDQLEAFRRQWHCISADSLVFSDKGMVPVSELCEEVFKVWDGNSFCEARAFPTSIKNKFKTKLNDGSSIDTSCDHRFLSVSNDGDLEFKRQKELRIGDYIVINDIELNNEGSVVLKLDPSLGKDVPYEIKIDEDFAEMLGWFLCDGTVSCYGRRNVAEWYFNPHSESEIRDKYFHILNNLGFSPRLATKDSGSLLLSVVSKPLIQAFFELGYCKSSEGKRFPVQVFSWPINLRRAFIRGMMSADAGLFRKDADESQSHGVVFTKKHKSIIDGLLMMFNSVGIAAFVNSKNYQVAVQDREKYFNDIGFIQSYKNEFSIDDVQNRKWDILPDQIAFKYSHALFESDDYKKLSRNDRLLVCSILRGSRRISRKVANRLFGNIEELKYRYVSVREIIDLKSIEQMYDVEVFNDKHFFISNGMVIHNSQVSGVQNSWKTPIMALGENSKMNWLSLHSTNREMEWGKYMEYLIKTICSVYQIDPIEIGFDISRNPSGQGAGLGLGAGFAVERIEHSKDKGLVPILRFIQSLLNDYIIWRIDPDFEFEFVGLNIRDEKSDLEVEEKQVKTFKTVNELRAEHDLPPIKTKDLESPGDYILDTNFLQAANAAKMAEQGGGMGMPGQPGQGQMGQPGQDQGEVQPDYANMSTEDLQAELGKLEGKGKKKQVEKSLKDKISSLEIIF